MKANITFTIVKKAPCLNKQTKNLKDSLHEALCLAIFEGNEEALTWLENCIQNIEETK